MGVVLWISSHTFFVLSAFIWGLEGIIILYGYREERAVV